MFQQLLLLFPNDAGTTTMLVAAFGSLLGMGLWLVGARFSRPILALAAVGLGAGVGMKLPLWCGWSVDAMGPAVAGAVLLGVSAFALHRIWVGMWLGTVLAGWSALILWTLLRHGVDWRWPDATPQQTLPAYLGATWTQLPQTLQIYLPVVALASLVAGIASALRWPRMGLVVMWSAAGASLLAGMGTLMLWRLTPAAIAHLPKPVWSQCLMLCICVAVGATVQWRLIRPAAGGPKPPGQNPQKASA